MLVASIPLKNKLVLVVRVPLTDGDWFPLPLVNTGDSSVLTPASVESSCVKLLVDVGTVTRSSEDNWRKVVELSTATSDEPSVMFTMASTSPISSLSSTVRVDRKSVV